MWWRTRPGGNSGRFLLGFTCHGQRLRDRTLLRTSSRKCGSHRKGRSFTAGRLGDRTGRRGGLEASPDLAQTVSDRDFGRRPRPTRRALVAHTYEGPSPISSNLILSTQLTATEFAPEKHFSVSGIASTNSSIECFVGRSMSRRKRDVFQLCGHHRGTGQGDWSSETRRPAFLRSCSAGTTG